MTMVDARRWVKKEAPMGLTDAEVLCRLRNMRVRDPKKRAALLTIYHERKDYEPPSSVIHYVKTKRAVL